MSLSAAEKLEVIRLVEGSELPVRRTLRELGVSRSSFYRWYRQYLDDGPGGLEPNSRSPRRFWNKLPETVKEQCLEIALQHPDTTRVLSNGTYLSHEMGRHGKIMPCQYR